MDAEGKRIVGVAAGLLIVFALWAVISSAQSSTTPGATVTEQAQAVETQVAQDQADAQATATQQAQDQADATATAIRQEFASGCTIGVQGQAVEIQYSGTDQLRSFCSLLKQQGTYTNSNGVVLYILDNGVDPSLQLICTLPREGGTESIYDSGLHINGSRDCGQF